MRAIYAYINNTIDTAEQKEKKKEKMRDRFITEKKKKPSMT